MPGPTPGAPLLDLPSLYMAAMQTRRAQEEAKLAKLQGQAAQRQLSLSTLLPQARMEAFQGNPIGLQRLAPQEAVQIQESLLDHQARTADTSKKFAEGYVKSKQLEAQTMLNVAMTLRQNPQAFPQMRQELGALQERGLFQGVQFPEQPPAPEELDQMTAVAEQQLAAFDDPEITNDMVNAAAEIAPGMNVMQVMRTRPDDFRAAMAKQRASRATTVNVGTELTTAQQTKQQDEVQNARKRLQLLENMKAAIKDVGGYDAFGSYTAEGKGLLRKIGAKAGLPVDREAIKRRATALGAISRFTDPIISELSGANVPPAEYTRIVQSLPDRDDDGPTLEAKVESWDRNLRFIEQFGIDALVNGIRTGEVVLAGEQPRASGQPGSGDVRARARTRAAELAAAGKTEAEAMEILKREGLVAGSQGGP
jgi:hypothetical protein